MHLPHSPQAHSRYFDYPFYPFRPPAEMAGAARTYPVAIVGAGPIGLVLALELGRRRIDTVLIEAAETVSPGSRATCTSRRSMEILQQNGAEAAFMAKALMWTHGSSFYREHMVYRLQMPHSDDERFYPMANIQQCVLEKFLVDSAQQQPQVDLRWQTKVSALARAQDHVTLTLDTPRGEYSLNAQYVVAADGARSTLRELMGLRLNGESHSGRYLIADIRMKSDYPTERRAWFDPPSNPGNTILMHKQPDDIWRIDYQLGADDDEAFELQEARIRERVQQHLSWIGETAPWELEWFSLYKAHCLCLDDYRHGRVLFAGDAAHLVPIFGVRGMNSGIADANNLGWKLAYVLQGQAPDSLLDSYTPERRAATLDIFANARKSTLFMTPPTRGYRLVRDAALQLAVEGDFTKPLINPRQTTPYDYLTSPLTTMSEDEALFHSGPRPGAPLVNVRLENQGHLLDHLGADFTLIAFTWDTHAPRPRLIPESWDTRVKHILVVRSDARANPLAGESVILDSNGHVHERCDANEGTAYLVRPDGHVCARWRTPRLSDVAGALARACGF